MYRRRNHQLRRRQQEYDQHQERRQREHERHIQQLQEQPRMMQTQR